jgi:hypothetical protein
MVGLLGEKAAVPWGLNMLHCNINEVYRLPGRLQALFGALQQEGLPAPESRRTDNPAQ